MVKKAARYSHNLFGIIKQKEGNLDGAIEELQETKSLLPGEYEKDHGQAFFLFPLAMAYSDAGNNDAAQQEYEKILSLTTGRFYYGDLYITAQEKLNLLRNN